MARLTASIRNAIINNAVANKQFKERENVLLAQGASLSENVRLLSIEAAGTTDEEIEKHVRVIEKHGEKLKGVARVTIDSNARAISAVTPGGERRWFYFSGEISERGFQHFTPVKSVYKVTGSREFSIPRSYGEEYDYLYREIKKLHSEHEVLVATLTETLKNFTTVEKLIASWPEAEQLLPAAEVAATGTDVALSVDTLNAICGLPK